MRVVSNQGQVMMVRVRYVKQTTGATVLIYILWAYPWRRNSSFRLSIKFQFVSFMQFFQLLCCHLKILQIYCEKSLFSPKIDLFCDVCAPNGILLPKLFWPTVRKNCSSDREKLLKFDAEGREFARSLEQFIQTVKV